MRGVPWRQFQLQPQTLMCNGTCKNKIRRRATYYTLPGNMKFHWCQQVHTSMSREPFMLEGQQIVKSELKKKKNDKEIDESWAQCDQCNRWVHQVCALFNVKKNGVSKDDLFFCPECILENRDSGDSRPSEQLENTAEKLPSCEMSDYMERFCRNVLIKARQDEARASGKSLKDYPDLSKDITVRVIMSKREKLDVRDGFYRRYKGIGYPEEVDYVSKAILMFYKVDNIDVLIFGMYVQEFDESAHEPSKRSVYISYLDSVRMIEPTSWRTKLYKEFIISYLSYSRERGFTNAFIWSCPPAKGDDYIFHCKPEDQKTPKAERLRMWYQDLLQKGVKDGLIYRVTTMWDNFFAPKIDPLERMVLEREERESSLFGAEDGFLAEERDDSSASAGAGGDASKAKQRSRTKRKISMNAKVKTKAKKKKKKPTSNAQKVRGKHRCVQAPVLFWRLLARAGRG